jgi:hypothetical protein
MGAFEGEGMSPQGLGRRVNRRTLLFGTAGAGALVLLGLRGTPSARGIPVPPATPIVDASLGEVTAATWAYFASTWAAINHLPCSWRSETIAGGDYANPAEIGLYMYAWLAAYEMGRPWSPSWERAAAEIEAILDQLLAWQTGSQPATGGRPDSYKNKVFRQTYWISASPPSVSATPPDNRDRQAPSIDNAWLAVCLICVRGYLRANLASGVEFGRLEAKAGAVLSKMDFRIWFHAQTSLFSWLAPDDPLYGSGPEGMATDRSSENRVINFVARALGHITKAELDASLQALQSAPGTYNGIRVEQANWDGSFFAYLSPALFIHEMRTPYGRDTLDRATQAQIAYARDRGYPVWGISDTYDADGGGYATRGAPPRRSNNPDNDPDDGLVAPHAGALGLITAYADEAVANLATVRAGFPASYDSRYGFRDSVMADPANRAKYGRASSRFSALGQAWAFLALINAQQGIVWRDFYRDAGVIQTHDEMFPGQSFTRTYLPRIYKDPTPIPSPTPAPCGMTPGQSMTLTFMSGVNERGRQTVSLQPQGGGEYSVVLRSANPPNTGRSLVWDYVALLQGAASLWRIGQDEAPPDYSAGAFDEFCDTNTRSNCTTNFVVNSTSERDFSKDLNDALRSAAQIDFALDDEQARQCAQLVLSTLYATHDRAPDFKMDVTFQKR